MIGGASEEHLTFLNNYPDTARGQKKVVDDSGGEDASRLNSDRSSSNNYSQHGTFMK